MMQKPLAMNDGGIQIVQAHKWMGAKTYQLSRNKQIGSTSAIQCNFLRMLRLAIQTTTTIATTLSQRNRTGEKLIGGKLSFRTEMLRKLKCNRGKADYWKTLWLHFVRPPPPSQHRIEDLMQSPLPECVCVCVTHVRVAELIYECFYRMSAKKAKNCCAGRCLDPFHRSPPQRAVSLSRRSRRSFWRPL